MTHTSTLKWQPCRLILYTSLAKSSLGNILYKCNCTCLHVLVRKLVFLSSQNPMSWHVLTCWPHQIFVPIHIISDQTKIYDTQRRANRLNGIHNIRMHSSTTLKKKINKILNLRTCISSVTKCSRCIVLNRTLRLPFNCSGYPPTAQLVCLAWCQFNTKSPPQVFRTSSNWPFLFWGRADNIEKCLLLPFNLTQYFWTRFTVAIWQNNLRGIFVNFRFVWT